LHARAVRHFSSAHSSEINELAALAGRALAEAGRGNALHETRLVALSNAKSTHKRETTGADRHAHAEFGQSVFASARDDPDLHQARFE
jgi:hypothetical protein